MRLLVGSAPPALRYTQMPGHERVPMRQTCLLIAVPLLPSSPSCSLRPCLQRGARVHCLGALHRGGAICGNPGHHRCAGSRLHVHAAGQRV